MLSSDQKLPWLILRLQPDMTRVRFCALIDHFQTPELVLGAAAQEIASLRGFDENMARRILEAPNTVDPGPELELMARFAVDLVTLEDPRYPENLKNSSFPPPMLYVRGTLEPADKYALAIVGSRHATQYGKTVSQQFTARFSSIGLTIISGFARGIDSAAHQQALKSGGRTIAVLGNGLSVTYPAENRKLGDDIAAGGGALVTEYPMTNAPERYNFPERNHVIAALSLGVVVVEAAEKSGALITAREAVEENRFVFAVPGDVTRVNSRGANGLIQQGARLAQRPDDVLMEMKDQLRGYIREELPSGEPDSARTEATPPAIKVPPSNLTGEEQHVLCIIAHEPVHYDVLLSRVDPSQVKAARLPTILLSLELKQAVKQMPGKVYAVLG